MKITSNRRAVHSFPPPKKKEKKKVSHEDGLVEPKHVVTVQVTYVLIALYDTYILIF
jgi:hypothetical protein